MLPGTFRWRWPNVFREHLSFRDIFLRDVSDQPVTKLSVVSLSSRYVGICSRNEAGRDDASPRTVPTMQPSKENCFPRVCSVKVAVVDTVSMEQRLPIRPTRLSFRGRESDTESYLSSPPYKALLLRVCNESAGSFASASALIHFHSRPHFLRNSPTAQ